MRRLRQTEDEACVNDAYIHRGGKIFPNISLRRKDRWKDWWFQAGISIKRFDLE